jgi:SAM-dependent methyltransferase
MRNEADWHPTKFVIGRNGLEPTHDVRHLAPASRAAVYGVTRFYGRVLPIHARGRLLDLGCGTVPFYGAYRPYVSEIVCVDWGNSLHEQRHVDVVHDLTKPLPFPDSSFDTIILSDVLEHLPEPEAAWHEMGRVLAPGGKLILSVPFLYWLHETPHDYYRYSEFALRRFADRAGFDVVELEAGGGAPEVLVDVASKMVRNRAWAVRFVQSVGGWLTRTRVGRKLSSRTAKVMPLGYGLVAARR